MVLVASNPALDMIDDGNRIRNPCSIGPESAFIRVLLKLGISLRIRYYHECERYAGISESLRDNDLVPCLPIEVCTYDPPHRR